MMMIPASLIDSYSSFRKVISDRAMDDLDSLMLSVLSESPRVQREALMDLLPEMGDLYAGSTSMVAAQFFDELMDLQDVAKPVAADTIMFEDPDRWRSLVDWGADDYVFDVLGDDSVYSRIAGGITKTLTEIAADTIIGNGQLQRTTLSAQRVPKPGCCAFCSMLASRGAVYSPESAAGVVGRGAPIGSHPLAKGIKPRGSRQAGQLYHDFCRCEVVVLTRENEAELKGIEEKHLKAYGEAYTNTQQGRELRWKETRLKDGSLKKKHYWVKAGKTHTHQNATSDIVAFMRSELSIK